MFCRRFGGKMQKKFITVDEDSNNIDKLTCFFKRYGIYNDKALSVEEAKKKIEENDYDVVIMEVILPGGGGIELTKWVKEKTSIPVILLTSLNEDIDTAIGLEIGADDYIHKPCDARVLLARINAILRIYKNSAILQTKEISRVFHINRRILVIDGLEVTLNSSEFIFIKTLFENQGNPVSREKLFEVMFGKEWNSEDRTVDNIVNKIRKKIEKNPESPKHIITVRNKGYLIPEGHIR
jgi:DNA-binding response OmpR family regulator